jgi:hypothetical protein
MNVRTISFLIVIGIFVASLVAVALYYYQQSRRRSAGSWQQLLERLTSLDREGIAQIALDYADESGERRLESSDMELEPSQIWKLSGGLNGLEAIEKNCAVLVDLTFYMQKWHPEAVVLAEELRLNAREIEWHVERLRGAANTGNLDRSFVNYAQPAIAKYYLMTQRVLALYQRQSVPMFTELQRAI